MTTDPSDFERNKLVVERLYTKIDYLKGARLRVPVFVAAANFALLTLSSRAVVTESTGLLFTAGFLMIGMVGVLAMFVVKTSFDGNVEQLRMYYEKMQIDPGMAEHASRIWWLLLSLVFIACALPVLLVAAVEFIPVPSRIP